MKAVIYAGIGLFSIATIYGAADYFQSKTKGTLKELYTENPPDKVVEAKEAKNEVREKSEVAPTRGTTTEISKIPTKKASSKAKARRSRTLKFDDFSRGRIIDTRIAEDKIESQSIKFSKPVKKEVIAVEEKKERAKVEPQPERRISCVNILMAF